jgi:hypothetical protein
VERRSAQETGALGNNGEGKEEKYHDSETQRTRAEKRAVGSWQKHFLCSNQAGTSPHERWTKFSENYFSWRDLFCFCGKTRNPHWLWLAARTEFRIFSDRQVFRLDPIFKHSKIRAKHLEVNRKSIPLCKL